MTPTKNTHVVCESMLAWVAVSFLLLQGCMMESEAASPLQASEGDGEGVVAARGEPLLVACNTYGIVRPSWYGDGGYTSVHNCRNLRIGGVECRDELGVFRSFYSIGAAATAFDSAFGRYGAAAYAERAAIAQCTSGARSYTNTSLCADSACPMSVVKSSCYSAGILYELPPSYTFGPTYSDGTYDVYFAFRARAAAQINVVTTCGSSARFPNPTASPPL